MSENTYEPNIAIHPGETLQELLEAVSMSQAELSERTGLAVKTINEIVQGKNPITPETANKLSSVFGMSAQFWNNLQRNYDETLARIERDENIKNELPYLPKFSCYKELVHLKLVPKTLNRLDKLKNLLNFFGVSSLSLVPQIHSVAFRKAKYQDLSSESLAAWLRCGELSAKADLADIKTFDKEVLKQSMQQLRSLTVEPVDVFREKMIQICADAGVIVKFIPYFAKTYVNGATRWVNDNPLIQLSLRGGRADGFWFTFFHELGHIIKHGKKDEFVEFGDIEDYKESDSKELEADEFAQELLIPKSEYVSFVRAGLYDSQSIKIFAKKINIDAGIVAGRLARDPNITKVTYQDIYPLQTKLKFVL